MAEEKLVKLNLRKELKKVPVWKRQSAFAKIIREKFKDDNLKISQGLNEKFWSEKNPKIRVKIVKDEKTTRVEFVE